MSRDLDVKVKAITMYIMFFILVVGGFKLLANNFSAKKL